MTRKLVGVVVVVVVAACQGSSSVTPDAHVDPGGGGGRCPCSAVPQGVPSCGGPVCGNGQLDTCYTVSPMGCHCVEMREETCDGNAPSCTTLGFYAGTTTCSNQCFGYSTASCDACSPTAIECATLAPFVPSFAPAVSGSYVALASDGAVSLYNGLSPVVGGPVLIANVSGLVEVPNGWLVATKTPASLSTLDPAGVRGTPVLLPADATNPELANAADRVLVAWKHQDSALGWREYVAITDTSGTTVVSAFDLFGAPINRVSVTSDGTSFFIGGTGTLFHMAPDGTFTTDSGFPIQSDASMDLPDISWSGTTGWYVSYGPSATKFIAQRFDASGAKVGAAMTVNPGLPILDVAADGDDLLVLVYRADKRLAVVRMDANGVSSPDVEAGSGDYGGGAATGRLGHLGSDALVVWLRPSHLQLARVAP